MRLANRDIIKCHDGIQIGDDYMALTDLGRVCPVARGEYVPATNYTRLDIVTFEGSSYICKATSTGNSPINTTYWQVLAQGALGEAGTPTKQNLLHNWDFRQPVNQREVSGAISTAGYFYDRWLLNSGAVTTNAAYLTVGAEAVIEQRIEGNLLAGAVVTVSVMVAGMVINNTGTMPTSTGEASATLSGWGTATLGYATGYMYVRLSPAMASNVQAVKLEMGTVSTLAYDPPMDHAVEVTKCKRFYRFAEGPVWNAGMVDGSLVLEFEIPYPDSMRIAPTLVVSSNLTNSVLLPGQSWHTPSFIGQGYEAADKMFYVQFYLPEAVAGRFFAFMSQKVCRFTADI